MIQFPQTEEIYLALYRIFPLLLLQNNPAILIEAHRGPSKSTGIMLDTFLPFGDMSCVPQIWTARGTMEATVLSLSHIPKKGSSLDLRGECAFTADTKPRGCEALS